MIEDEANASTRPAGGSADLSVRGSRSPPLRVGGGTPLGPGTDHFVGMPKSPCQWVTLPCLSPQQARRGSALMKGMRGQGA